MILRLCIFLLLTSNSYSQVTISFNTSWKGTDNLVIDQDEQITTLKWYISNIKFYHQSKEVFYSSEAFLIDYSNPQSTRLIVDYKQDFDSVSYMIGIDNEHNINGVFGGDLDPTNGMYWAWHSGYINIKIEGISSSVSNTKNDFSYHLGGYEEPFESSQIVGFKTNSSALNFTLNLDQILTEELFSELLHLMLPGAKAQELSKSFAGCFKLNHP